MKCALAMAWALAWLVVATACSPAAGPDASCELRQHAKLVELEVGDAVVERGWPIAVGTVNGMAARFLIDTGAQGGIDLDLRRFADHLEFDDDGFSTADVEVLGNSFPAVQVHAWDYSIPGWYGIDGIVGGELLAEKTLEIDYASGRIWIGDDADAPLPSNLGTAGAVRLEEADLGHRLVHVRLEEVSERLLLDTGASVLLVSGGLITELGRRDRPSVDTGPFRPGTETRSESTSFTRIDRINAGGAKAVDVPVFVMHDSAPGGLLGYPFFRNFFFRLEGPSQSLTLFPYEGALPYRDEFLRLGFDVTPGRGGWVVTQLFGGSSAAEQLQLGDVIERIDGQGATGDRRARTEDLLMGYGEGCEVKVDYRRSGRNRSAWVTSEQLLP